MIATIVFIVGFGCAISVEELRGFGLEKTGLLRGFAPARVRPGRYDPQERIPTGAIAVKRGRYFHGSSELRFIAAQFPTRAEAEEHARQRIRKTSSGLTFWSAERDGKLRPLMSFRSLQYPEDSDALPSHDVDWRKPPKRGADFPRFVIADRVVIVVWSFQHPEAKRRDPTSFRRALPDSELQYRADRIAQHFVRAAMKIHGKSGFRTTSPPSTAAIPRCYPATSFIPTSGCASDS